MITFNVIIERFKAFASNHFFIQSFSHGTPEDLDLDKFTKYPLMHVVYTGSNYGSGSKTYSMEVFVMGAGPTTQGKFEVAQNAVSDAEQCLEDILADLTAGWNIFDESINLGTASISPLMHEDHNTLVGAALVLSLEVPYDHSACHAPLDGIDQGTGDKLPSYQRRGVLLIQEADGTPSVKSVRTIIVPNDSLTDDGNGQVTLDFQTGGGQLSDQFKKFVCDPIQNAPVQLVTLEDATYFPQGDRVTLPAFNWTITGLAPIGFVVDNLGRWIDITGLSSNMRFQFTVNFKAYALTTAYDIFFFNMRIEKTGSTAYNDNVVYADLSPPPSSQLPVGAPFIQSYIGTLQTPIDVLIFPDWRIELVAGSAFGTIMCQVEDVTIDVTAL